MNGASELSLAKQTAGTRRKLFSDQRGRRSNMRFRQILSSVAVAAAIAAGSHSIALAQLRRRIRSKRSWKVRVIKTFGM